MPCVSSTDFRKPIWTVTVVNQRRLLPMLSPAPRITPPVHHRGRGGWTQRFQTAKVTFKVTKVHP